MSIENQIAINADEQEEYCPECEGEMTISMEGGYDILICDNCSYKVWTDGDEY